MYRAPRANAERDRRRVRAWRIRLISVWHARIPFGPRLLASSPACGGRWPTAAERCGLSSGYWNLDGFEQHYAL